MTQLPPERRRGAEPPSDPQRWDDRRAGYGSNASPGGGRAPRTRRELREMEQRQAAEAEARRAAAQEDPTDAWGADAGAPDPHEGGPSNDGARDARGYAAGHDPRNAESPGYDPRDAGRPGYDPRDAGRPGYDPRDAGRPGYDDAQYGGQSGYDDARYGGQSGYDDPQYGGQPGYDDPRYGGQPGSDDRGYSTQGGYDDPRYGAEPGYDDPRSDAQSGHDPRDVGQRGYDPRHGDRPGGYDDRQGYPEQGYDDRQGYPDRGYGYDDRQGYPDQGYDDRQGYPDRGYGYDDRQGYPDRGYDDRGQPDQGYPDRAHDDPGADAPYATDDRVGYPEVGRGAAEPGDPHAAEDAVRSGRAGLVAQADPHEADPFADWDDDPSRPSRSDRRSASSWELEEHEREPNRRRRGAWGCLIALLVLAALVAGAAFFLQGPITSLVERFQPPADYSGAGTGEVVFMINEGDGGEAIAANLEGQDIVASAEAFIDEVTSRSPEPVFYPGAYQMANQMSAADALDALLDPDNKLENTFVIQEGLWARDALAAASTATGIPLEDLQAAASDPQALGLPEQATSVEGFLFPATYTFGPDVTAQEVVQTLVDRSFQALDEAGVAPEDRWQTIIIASLIEREAGSETDAYKVSRVIRNRLDENQFPSQLLQFDSTVHYGTGDDTVVTTTDAERADESNPYNTYVHPGLPPGPIGNPGDVAIDAAQHPADGPWLYFVTVNLETGETVFSATLEEHEAAVEQFLRYLDENG
ncbi:hypothetical protein GCM10009819_04250 [Agromyces tropicus]|uniref:Endolytic murein transglycosylase n=1 Tax=Agromyces tropicus TaxID=555371 RepID=A0ABN2TXW4_9MICO